MSATLNISVVVNPAVAAAGTTVVITAGTSSWTFSSESATDLGTYNSVDESISQKLLTQQVSGCPLILHFRPDANGLRDEVVFENPVPLTGSGVDFAPYTVSISSPLGTYSTSLAVHPRGARWRWQSAPRPKVATYADLIAAGLIPGYETPSPALPAYTTSVKPYAPMGLGSVVSYMQQTGGRDDIGLLPEWWARAIIGDASAEAQAWANAEAAGSFNIHVRDETGSPISLDRHPTVKFFASFPGVGAYTPPGGREVVFDIAHCPSLSYVRYLLTGDLYDLEEVQFYANAAISAAGAGIVPLGQVRGLAWGLRNLFEAAATPDSVPSVLLPRSYFLQVIANSRPYLDSISRSQPALSVQAFGLFGYGASQQKPAADGTISYDIWQRDFLSQVLGFFSGIFQEWETLFAWSVQSCVDRTAPDAGWSQGYPSIYHADFYDSSGNLATTWSELAADNGVTPGPSATLLPEADIDYVSQVRGVLALAKSRGIASADAGYAYLEPLLTDIAYEFSTRYPIVAPGSLPAQPVVAPSAASLNWTVTIPSGQVDAFTIPNGAAATVLVLASAAGQTVMSPWMHKTGSDEVLDFTSGVAMVINVHAGGNFMTNADYIQFPSGGGYYVTKTKQFLPGIAPIA